jgi:opacity protein-like surface antigen
MNGDFDMKDRGSPRSSHRTPCISGIRAAALLVGFVCLLGTAPPALAESAGAEPESPWGFVFEPYLWVAGLEGKVGSDEGPAVLGTTFADLIEHLKLGAMGAVSVRYKRLGVFADGNWVQAESSAPLPLSGITGLTHVDVTAGVAFGTAAVFYRFQPRDGLTLDPYVGARWWRLETDLKFKPGGPKPSPKKVWADPVFGLQLNYDINPRWFVESMLDVGGGVSKVTWQLYGGTGYNFSDSFALSIGWRYIGVDYDEDGFLFDTTLSGLLTGLKFRF